MSITLGRLLCTLYMLVEQEISNRSKVKLVAEINWDDIRQSLIFAS